MVSASFDTLDMTDSFSENRQLEDEADDILDFTERNPFGEFGNFTGSFNVRKLFLSQNY